MLRGTASFQIAVAIGKAHNRIRIANIDPLGIRSGRIKTDTEWTVKSRSESLRLRGLAVGTNSAEDQNVVGVAFGDEEIAVGRGANQSRLIKPGRIKLNFEARKNLWPRVLWTRHQLRAIAGRRRSERLGQIFERDLAGRA